MDLQGRRALVVEDESLVAMMLEDLLADFGCEVVVALSLDEALAVAEGGSFDFAILDVNLNGTESYPIAERLRARGIPFLFSSGYDGSALKPPFDTAPTVQKPYRQDTLLDAVGAALSGS